MKKIIIGLAFCALSVGLFAQSNSTGVKVNKKKLIELAEKWNNRFEATSQLIKQKAVSGNFELIKEVEGNLIQLKGFSQTGMPIYYQTDNIIAAQSISTDKVYPGASLGLNLTGSTMTIGEWDGGGVLESHQEYGGRATNMDNPSSTHYHAAHVAGTIMAAGVDPFAKGMAYQATLSHYDWSNDESEMAAEAANGLLISNHSYSLLTGWSYNYHGDGRWAWFGDASISETDDYRQGFYDSQAQEWDQIAFNAPYYLILRAAGNARNDEPSTPGEEHWYRNPNTGYSWELSTTTRLGDGPYDCINGSGVSKNILTVGAVEDVNGGYNGTNSVTMSSFSSWGPTDDGRIKPDVVANGVSVYSTYDNSTTAYNSISGTSMATPSVTGSLALVQEHSKNETNKYLKAATLKGLTIHTADECGTTAGPDYAFGWGLVNIAKAVDVISNQNVSSLIYENTLTNNQTETFDVYSDGSTPLIVTISWTDPAGNVPNASVDNRTKVLINDLNLKVTGNGQDELPWKLNPAAPSAAATKGVNDVDNIEKVEILNPVAGSYTITINHAGSLFGGSQDYAVIVTGIQSQPSYCAGNVTFNGNTGSFSDGSLDQDYQANSNCTWLINPVGATSIELSFSAFDLDNSDVVNVYDGNSNAGTLLNSYTGNNIPANVVLNNDEMFVEFIADGTTEAPGFSASYEAEFPATYCIPDGNTTDGDYINNVFVGTINNTETGSAAGPDYTFYSNLSTDLAKGATYNLTTTSGTNTANSNYVAGWIDYNKDGDFDDAGEKLGEFELNQLPNQTSNISFTVPSGVDVGVTRLRVRLNWGVSPVMPCAVYDYGETEDYIVNIVESNTGYCIPDQSANGTSNGYFINMFRALGMNNAETGGVGNAEYTFYNGDTMEVNRLMTFDYASELGDVTYASIAVWIDYDQNEIFDDAERVGSYFFPQANTPYRLNPITIPSNAKIGVTRMRVRTYPNGEEIDPCFNHDDQETEDYLIKINEADSYCIPTVRCDGLDNNININGVEIGAIDNQNTGVDGGIAYNFYNNFTTDIKVGTNEVLKVKVGDVYSPAQYIAAWIDYNRDGDFNDAGEKLGEMVAVGNDAENVFNFNVPSNASYGVSRLRIRNTHELNNLSACGDFETFGETVDYLVNIIANPCANYPEKPSVMNGAVEVCPTDNITYSVTDNNAFESYEWTLPNGWSGNSTTNTIDVSNFVGAGQICVRGYSAACGYTNASSCLTIDVISDLANGELAVTGDTLLCSNGVNIIETYTLTHNITGVESYNWNFPAEATVLNGQGTQTIELDLSNVSKNSDFEICAVVSNDCFDREFCLLVDFEICTSIAEHSMQNMVQLYPNPTNGIFNIKSQQEKIIKIAIYDVQGKLVLSNYVENSDEVMINLSENNKGIYNVVVETEKGSINKRVTVQ